MVVGVFPIAKLGALLFRQMSKPVANFVKERAKHSYFFRTYVCMPPAQFYNWCEVRVKMWFLNMGKPDSIPPLNEQMAIELGANLLGETIVFVSAAGVILFEYSRQLRKEETKENARREEIVVMQRQIQDLDFRVETQDAQLRRVLHSFAELDSKTIRIPWKGSGKPADQKESSKKDDKQSKKEDNKSKDDKQSKKEDNKNNVQVTQKENSAPVSSSNDKQTKNVPEKMPVAKEEEKKR